MAQQNIALNRPTSTSSFVKPYESARAVNGAYGATTPTSRWLCNTLPGWLMVDLGVNGSNAYWINRWVVRHMTVAGWRTPDYNVTDFKLQGSNDNNAWYDIDSVVGNTVGITDRTFAAVSYRYVRLYVTKGLKCNTKMASVMELEVYQSPPLSAYLQTSTGLTVSSGALSPNFVNNVFTYTTPNVANSVESVAVKPTAEDSRAIIKVNGVVVISGNSTNVALNVGSNAISVQVTAADGMTTNTYTVTVVRDAAPAVAYLTGLALNTTATPSVPVPYTPTPFDKDTTAYSASVGYDVDKIVVTPTTDITGATITVNGASPATPVSLSVGSNAIPVVVTNGTATKTYTVTVTRASSPYLSNITVSSGTLVFSKTTYAYTVNVGYDVTSIIVTPTAEDSNAKITVNTTDATGGKAVTINSLAVGNNPVTILVNSATGVDSRTYTINVVRSSSAYLSKLQSSITFTPSLSPFVKTQFTYSASVSNAVTTVSVKPTLEDSAASIMINNSPVANTSNTIVSLVSGTNTITIEITPATGNVKVQYILTVTKP